MNDPETLIILGFIFLLLLCSAFFSGSETALMSSSKPKLHEMEKDGNTKAARVNKLTADPEKLLSTILLGNNLVNISASALTTGLFIHLFGEGGIAAATLVMTFLVLIFSEIIPKTIASRSPVRHSMWLAFPMSILIFVLKPLTYCIQGIANFLLRLMGVKLKNCNNFDEDDVRGAIGMGLEEGVLEKGEHRMLDSVMKLDEMTVEDVMVHRRDIEMIDASVAVEELYRLLSTKPVHSRIPIWKDNKDNIIGILLIKDFFKAYYNYKECGEAFVLENVMKDNYFIPENVLLSDQLVEFQSHRKHLALVVDEYGDIQGVVTLEDILEEIVGEIIDEHDVVKITHRYEKDGSITVAGHFPVRDANREFDWHLPENEDAVTLSGLIIDQLGRMPELNETFELNGLEFKIIGHKNQSITQLCAKKIELPITDNNLNESDK
ncbi:MAG: Mg2+/Co2+ transporter CorB [Alphaproteobacteria bacterium]|jgi:Mg2+/Co2+ transporter CorB